MKRDEFDRLLDDFLDGELNEEGSTLLRSALDEDSGLAGEADSLERLEKILRTHFTPFREARAPEKDHASRILRRLRLERETSPVKGGWFSLPGFQYLAVAGYTFLIALFSVLVTLNVIAPGLVEQAAEKVRPDTERMLALQDENRTLKSENQNLEDEVREAWEQLNPDVNQPPLRIIVPDIMHVREDQQTEPLFGGDDEGMEQPYYKADRETIAKLWGLDPEDVGIDETGDETEQER